MLETFEIREDGEIKISDDVISVIATVATLKIDGVGKMSSSLTDDLTKKFKMMNNEAKGVKVEFAENSLAITLFIFIEYGHKIVEVAERVQEAVKESVEMMTDMAVKDINVIVEGISLDREPRSAKVLSRR